MKAANTALKASATDGFMAILHGSTLPTREAGPELCSLTPAPTTGWCEESTDDSGVEEEEDVEEESGDDADGDGLFGLAFTLGAFTSSTVDGIRVPAGLAL
jgi:hypothetical protein